MRKGSSTSDSLYYILSDHLGGTYAILNPDGTVVDTSVYYSFGESRSDPSGLPTDKLYTGQEFQTETGLYNYGARFYDPSIGRFISADSVSQAKLNGSDPQMPLTVSYLEPAVLNGLNEWHRGQKQTKMSVDPQLLNRYSYVRNNPLRGTDPTGHFADWIWDAGAVLFDIGALWHDPSWENAGYLGLDIVLGVVPFVPSGVGLAAKAAKGASNTVKIATKVPKLTEGAKYGIRTYSELRGALKGTGLQAHHLIEKRFAAKIGKTEGSLKAFGMTAEEHQQFTNRWRDLIGHSTDSNPITTVNVTRDQIWDAAQKIYEDYPDLLEAARQELFGL